MRWSAAFALLALTLPQGRATVDGRVVRVVGADTVGVAGARVVLHRVTPAKQGPIDSLLTGSEGRFRFRFARDSGAIYLTSARWAGIEYFAAPFGSEGDTSGPMVLVVSDTATAAPVRLAARHVVVSAPAADGTRAVLELLVLENPGNVTRVPGGTGRATWQLVLPGAGPTIALGEMDFAADAVVVRGDTLRIEAPLPPGQRQLTLQYQLPRGADRWTLTVQDTTAAMNVLLEEPSATVTGPLVPTDSQVVEGRRFSRWQGRALPGASIAVRFESSDTPAWLLPFLVASLALGLVASLLVARRRRPESVRRSKSIPRALPPDAESLLARIATLDRDHAGGPTQENPERWHAYLRERAELKRQLEAHLPL
ncbi:MAG: hypothetical protein ABJC19_01435 [Gemmatimonadota bacterium]